MKELEGLLQAGWIILKIDFSKIRPVGTKYYIQAYFRNTGLSASGYGETLFDAVSDFRSQAAHKIEGDAPA